MQDEQADPEGQRRGTRMMGAKQQTLDGELRKVVETWSERDTTSLTAHCPSQRGHSSMERLPAVQPTKQAASRS